MPIDPSFGSRLRALRESRGLSRDDLALVAGVDDALLYRYESGRSLPGWEIVCRLADALDCSLEQLRRDEPADLSG